VTDNDRFHAWAHELMCAMISVGRSAVGGRSPMIDAGIAYAQGMTPAQAANAILGLDRKAYSRLCDLSVHPDQVRDHEYRQDADGPAAQR
jgi:hypothetical protein